MAKTPELIENPDAAGFIKRLELMKSPEELEKIQRYFKTGSGEYGEGDVFLGVRMGDVFKLAKEFRDMDPDQIEVLLDDPIHEVRAGALKVMALQSAAKKTSMGRRRELFGLYLRRIDRANNWDLVDVGCVDVVGRYLYDSGDSREILYDLARSVDLWERRTAIISTLYFTRKGERDDTFALCEILVDDQEELIQKAVGGLLREAGKKDRLRLTAFLDEHAVTMPRVALRYSIEHLDEDQRAHYRELAD